MSYYHLTIDERCCIFNFLKGGMSIRGIAKALQRSPSTILREIKRNRTESGSWKRIYKYFPYQAQKSYDTRRLDCHRKSTIDKQALNYIEDKLRKNWFLEQIANRKTVDDKNT